MVFRRNRRQEPDQPAVDPLSALAPAYRATVADALRARTQFDDLVRTAAPGPLQERLRELGMRVEAAVAAVWDTARRATELERVVESLDPERVTAELKHARRGGADAEVVEALSARFASVQRLLDTLDTFRSRLPVLEARLGSAVARAAELAFTSSAGALDSLGSDLDTVVVELEALAQASAELR